MQRRRDGGNKYASLGVVHGCKETTCDEWLTIHLQPDEKQFALYKLMKQIRALAYPMKLSPLKLVIVVAIKPTPCFVNDDDVVTFSGARSQWGDIYNVLVV